MKRQALEKQTRLKISEVESRRDADIGSGGVLFVNCFIHVRMTRLQHHKPRFEIGQNALLFFLRG